MIVQFRVTDPSKYLFRLRSPEQTLHATAEVAPAVVTSALTTVVSFLPVFTLEQQEGRLFLPLAFTKTYSIAMASIVAVTVIPVLMFWFVRGKIHSEERHPVSRLLRGLYTPVLNAALRRKPKPLKPSPTTAKAPKGSTKSSTTKTPVFPPDQPPAVA